MLQLDPSMNRRPTNRRGFTLIELLVVIVVVALLLAISLPAVQQAREVSRRLQCKSNLRQLGLACANYESLHGMYPPGATSRGFSWLVCILPHLDQQPVYDAIDFSRLPSRQVSINKLVLPGTVCASDGRAGAPNDNSTASISYAGNSGTGIQAAGFNGMFRHTNPIDPYPGGPIRARDVIDGASQTALLSEILPGDGTEHWLRVEWYLDLERSGPDQLDQFVQSCGDETPRRDAAGNWYGDLWSRGRVWTQGDSGATWYNHVLTPMLPSCFNGSAVQTGAYTAASLHAGGVNVVFVDGHVEFVSTSIDRSIYRDYGSRVDRDLAP